MVAFLYRSLFLCRYLLFGSYLPTDLASRSEPLSPYEIFTTDCYTLARLRSPGCLAAQELDHFHKYPSKAFAFDSRAFTEQCVFETRATH